MADGLAERIKKFLRPVYDFTPSFGMGFGRGFSFMSQEDYSTKYGRLMPGNSWSNSKPHPDELDTPANRAKLDNELVNQEIGMAYRMAQSITSKDLKALYEQGRGAKHQIDTGNTFSIEYDKFGTATHVKLDFGDGEEWRSRVGFMSEAISQRERALAVEQPNPEQDHRDQVRAAVFAPVLEKLKQQSAENAEIYEFLSNSEMATQTQVQDIRQETVTVNVGFEWKEIDALADGFEPDPEQAALRLEVVERLREGDIESLNFEDEGVSFRLDGDKLVETWTNPDQSFAWDADKCDIPLHATEAQHVVAAEQQVAQEAPYELTEQDRLDMAEAQQAAIAEEDKIEHQERERQQPDYHAAVEARQAREAYEQDRERSVQEQIKENIEAGVAEDTDLYADYDRQTKEHEQVLKSEEAYELQHEEQTEILSEGRDREVFELYREAEYQHSEWMAGEREEAVDLSVAPDGVTEQEWARAASEYKEWEREQEENRQDFTNDEVLKMDQASEREVEERRQEQDIINEIGHLRTPDGQNFVEYVRDRQAQGHAQTEFDGHEYRIDGNEIVSRSTSSGEENRASVGFVSSQIDDKHRQAEAFKDALMPAQAQTVSSVETQNQSEPLNTQKTNGNQPMQEAEQPRSRATSLHDMAERAVARLERSGQKMSREAEAMIQRHEVEETQARSQAQGQRL